MVPQEKLKVLREKIYKSEVLNEEFGELVGIELYRFIHADDILKNEFYRRFDYFKNLRTSESFNLVEDKLFETIVKILKLTDEQEVEQRQREWGEKLLNRLNMREESILFSLPQAYCALQDRNNYHRLPMPRGGKIHPKTDTSSVRDQYEETVEEFFRFVFHTVREELPRDKEYNALKGKYDECWSDFDELVHFVPKELHVFDFEEFFLFCAEVYPREGYKWVYESLRIDWSCAAKNTKEFKEIKKVCLAVIDELLDILEIPNEPLYQKIGKKSDSPKLYLNDVGALWREPKAKYCYPMGENGNRYKIVYYLATNKNFQQTIAISGFLNNKSEQSIRTEIGKIRKNITHFLKIKGHKVIESKSKSGYRINPAYKITIKKE